MQRDIWIGRQKEEEEEEGRNLVHSFPLICLSQNLKSNHNPLQKGWSAEWYQIDLLPSEERGNGRGTTHWTACEKRNTMHKVPLAYIIVFSQKKKENWTLQQEACKLFSNYPGIKLIVGHSLSQTYVGWGCRRGGWGDTLACSHWTLLFLHLSHDTSQPRAGFHRRLCFFPLWPLCKGEAGDGVSACYISGCCLWPVPVRRD